MKTNTYGFVPEIGVAYIEVPRCDTCRWWSELKGWTFAAECIRSKVNHPELGNPAKFFTEDCEDEYGAKSTKLYTDPDFGCVEWEERRVQDGEAITGTVNG